LIFGDFFLEVCNPKKKKREKKSPWEQASGGGTGGGGGIEHEKHVVTWVFLAANWIFKDF
jgi:hypothetical protein